MLMLTLFRPWNSASALGEVLYRQVLKGIFDVIFDSIHRGIFLNAISVHF